MTIVICTDERGGRSFGGRRQSRDRVLCERVAALCGEQPLAVSRYSEQLFSFCDARRVTNDFNTLGDDELCFAEDQDPPFDRADRVIVYNWNRRYPSDKRWAFDADEFELVSQTEFAGSSHERITESVYVRRERSGDA